MAVSAKRPQIVKGVKKVSQLNIEYREEDEESVESDVEEESLTEDAEGHEEEEEEGSEDDVEDEEEEEEVSSDADADSAEEEEIGVKDDEEEEEEGSDVEEDNEAEIDDDDEEEQEEAQKEGDGDDEESGNEVKDEEEEEDDKSKNEIKPEISGWADSIAKILKSGKPKNKKELMLSRARKDYEVSKLAREPRPLPRDNLEIVPGPKKIKSEEESLVKEEKKPSVDDSLLSLKKQRQLELKQKKLERAWENLSRLTTEKTEPQVERDLAKIATKGVVQLFNAIALQQKTVKSKLKNRKSEFQKDKVLHQTKDIFDSALSKSKQMGKEREDMDIKVKTEVDDEELVRSSGRKRKSGDGRDSRDSKKKPSWNALQDNFMLDAKLKDWDQDSDDSD